MQNTGTLYAFDLDARRLQVMARLHKTAGVACTTVLNQSFLDADPADPRFAAVSKILIDPSCSGSGMKDRLDSYVANGPAAEAEHDADAQHADRLAALVGCPVLPWLWPG